ncbi:YlqD family protein [Bacillus carboniphilus]|uniref:YlqD family protein n=1 Tax=Bacillus carboniphilus TaxID=86663 RepID=A0ABY9JYG5_9BACI|nr:YlqD family protein [Bacillus carboniphilus]WLR43558.1 YlqD family protein [Bacillus carboniphilus]
MNIIQEIIVKQVVTPKSKQTLLNRFEQEKIKLEKEIDQLRFQSKKKDQGTNRGLVYKKEIDKRQEKIEVVEFQIQQLAILPLNSEIIESKAKGIVDVNVGDDWNQLMNNKTIVIEDGIVKEIR